MKRYVIFAYNHDEGSPIIDYLAAESDTDAQRQNARKRADFASVVWIGTTEQLREIATEADTEPDDTLQQEMNEYLD